MRSDTPYLNAGAYLRENHHAQAKDKDIRMADILADAGLPDDALVLDVGCATGALLGYLVRRFPGWQPHGLEPAEALVEEARRMLPGMPFQVGSALELPAEWEGRFDATLSTGVLGIFDEDDARRSLDEMLRVTRPGGLICVMANFNPAPADVWTKHRKLLDGSVGQWESGWNIYAERTVAGWLGGRTKNLRFVPFEISVDVARQEDPSRTYTFKDETGRRRLANGLCILAELQYLVAYKLEAEDAR
jgi:SAM-dependent methyltransferase